MKAGDIVKIVKQPWNLIVPVQGQVGYIDEIQGPYAGVQTMLPDGSQGGYGGVPLECLALEDAEFWKQAKAKLDAEKARYLTEAQARTARWKALVEKVAQKHQVSVETAEAIYNELGNFDP